MTARRVLAGLVAVVVLAVAGGCGIPTDDGPREIGADSPEGLTSSTAPSTTLPATERPRPRRAKVHIHGSASNTGV